MIQSSADAETSQLKYMEDNSEKSRQVSSKRILNYWLLLDDWLSFIASAW